MDTEITIIALVIGYTACVYIGFHFGGLFMARKIKNEQTSALVATKASIIMNSAPKIKNSLGDAAKAVEEAYKLLEIAEAVAASALTQAPDKKATSRKKKK